MHMITVYRYYTNIMDRHVGVRTRGRATLAAIERIQGVPMHETARVVDASQVDPEGFLKNFFDSGSFGAQLH
ncbi:MAG: hypothetical protein ACXWAC_16260 [Usitatibacter sp.]